MMSDLLSDIWNFFILFGVFQLGLTLTFYQLFRGHGDDAFGSLGQSFMTTYFVAFGQVPLDSLSVFSPSLDDNMSSSPTAMYTGVALLMMLHSAIVVVVLLNVLLALMNQTVTGGLEKAKTRALMSYAQCILRLEGAMHLNQAETIALTHVKDTCGKQTLHPIFSESVPRTNLVLTPDQAETLQRTGASRAAWLDQMQTLDKVVMDQIGFVVDGLDHVSHFTDLNVREVFAREFDVLATAQQQLLGAIEVARRSRGQFKKDILAKLEKRASKDLRNLKAQLLSAWNRSTATEPVDDHANCVMLHQINQRATLEALLTEKLAAITTALADVPRDDVVSLVDEENEKLRLELAELRTSTTKEIETVTARFEALTSQLNESAERRMEVMTAHLEMLSSQLRAIATQQGAMATQQDAAATQQTEMAMHQDAILSHLTNDSNESRSSSLTRRKSRR